MRNELILLFTALSYYSTIPLYNFGDFSPAAMKKANRYFPLVGWIVGGFAALVFILAGLVFPNSIALLLSMVSTIALTGAFHEDGLADSVDGFGGGYTKEKILEIMKDSRIGTYGAIALVSFLALKFAFLYEMDTVMLPFVLIAGHSISRFMAVTFLITYTYARQNDATSRSSSVSQKMSMPELIVAGVFGFAPIFLLGLKYFLVLIPLFIIRQVVGHYLNKRIGGFTGDTLGAFQQITELAFYVSVYLIALWTFI